MLNYIKYLTTERRQRYKLPFGIKLVATLLMILPIVNLLLAAGYTGSHLTQLSQLWGRFGWMGLLLMLSTPFLGAALLVPRRLVWRLFVAYLVIFLAYNLYLAFIYPGPYTIGALLRSIIGFAILFYFLRRDIRQPFMDPAARGFRGNTRSMCTDLQATIANRGSFAVRDLSLRGLYLDGRPVALEPGQSLDLRIGALEETFQTGVVHVSPAGVGLAFRKLKPAQKTALKQLLQKPTKTSALAALLAACWSLAAVLLLTIGLIWGATNC
ncbi:MAG: PilZ domain-containing protein [Leptospiraceae bacterium]|nr:PilZ domain-containing protein [Leptospiraceae bacterium]